jgi:hypothetical protein
MSEHGVEILRTGDGKSVLIPTAQPYGRFVDEMMGIQRYPEVRPAPSSGILEPYDVAAWSLPLMMGVNAERVRVSAEELSSARTPRILLPPMDDAGKAPYYAATDEQNGVFTLIHAMQKEGAPVFLQRTPGKTPNVLFTAHPKLLENAAKSGAILKGISALPKDVRPIKPVRVGIYKSYIASIDEGWTRFVLEQYGFNVKNIENKEVKAGNLNAAFDVIILPDSGKDVIVDGKSGREGGSSEELPPEYTGGIGKDGVRALREFADKGGTLIALAHASELFFGDDFNLPVRNAFATGEARRTVPTSEFNIPGSLLRVYVDNKHPVGYGMPSEAAAFVDAPIAFQTSASTPDVQRSVIAWYPEDARDILLSGYAHGAEKLARKAAVVSFTRGKGRIVLFGFRVQHRAQTEGTFQLLFNAIEWGAEE